MRVADALGAFVIQHNRREDWGRYRAPRRLPDISHVIVSREARALARVRERYPQARLYLWLHDRLHPGTKRARRLAASAALLREAAVTCICVSEWQRTRRRGDARRARPRAARAHRDALQPGGRRTGAGCHAAG